MAAPNMSSLQAAPLLAIRLSSPARNAQSNDSRAACLFPLQVISAYGARLLPGQKYAACNETITNSFDAESAVRES